MALLITVYAAVIATVKWYARKDDTMRLGMLCLMCWGAAIMWLVDAFFEYAQLGAAYFAPSVQDMLNDAFLGFSIVALGLIIWLVRLLISDPRGTVRAVLKKEQP